MTKRIIKTTYLLILTSLCSLKAYADTSQEAIFKMLLNTNSHPYFSQAYTNSEQKDLKKLYQLNENRLLWFSSKHPLKNINQVLNIYSSAPTHGLFSQDYAESYLRTQWQKIQQTNPDLYQFAAFDTALSLTFLRYLKDLHYGRIPPKLQGFRLAEKPTIDLASALYGAIKIDQIDDLAEDLQPKLRPYQQLKIALVKYRRLAQYFNQPLHFKLKKSLRPGEWSREVSKLHHYFDALNTPIDQPIILGDNADYYYTGDIVQQVKKLQTQNGQLSDGIIGKDTLAILNTPFSKRIEQIELAMERLRWIPYIPHGPFILVNIPAFQLWAYDIEQSPTEILNMKVIVGKSRHKKTIDDEDIYNSLHTPVFTGELSYLVFSPYWNIPDSILFDEILPLLEKQPDYLQRNNMEIVAQFSDQAKVYAINKENIQRLYSGQLKLRQRPGRRNALGHIKFIFPNNHAIYLHDTPTRSLFNRPKRDLSHGCIRVENPNALAQFVLRKQPEWNNAKIEQSMRANKPSIVNMDQAIPVLIFYTTALATKTGIAFYPDIYDLDSSLKSALNQRSMAYSVHNMSLLAII